MPFAFNGNMMKGFQTEAFVGIGRGSSCGVGGKGAKPEFPVLNSWALRCVLKTMTLQITPTRTINGSPHIASTHLTGILDIRDRVLVHIS